MAMSQEQRKRRTDAHNAARKKLGPQTPRPKKKKKKKKRLPKPVGRKKGIGDEARIPRRRGQRKLSALQEIKQYAAAGQLPHEFLLQVSRGEVIEWGTGKDRRRIVPSFEQRLEAAKVGAAYFAPKLAQIDVNSHLSDDDLLAIIASAAAAAGIGLSVSGGGKKKAGLSAPVGSSTGDGDGGITVDEEGTPVS